MSILIILFIFAFLLTRLSVSAGYRLGLVDHPSARKQHQGLVPLTGGIALFACLVFGALVLGMKPYTYATLAIITALFALGLFDDIRHIKPGVRLAIQFGAGLLLATWGGVTIVSVGNLLALGDIPLLALAVPLTALAVAGLSNAYNMIDGIDGLAAATMAFPLAVLHYLALQSGHPMAYALLPVLVGLIVFLIFNLGPGNRWLPKVFLGDAGSVAFGFFVTASLIYFSQGEQALIKPVTALWLVTVPLMDMLGTMLRRAVNGRKLMHADRSHLHHSLQDLGLNARQTLAVIMAWAALTTCAGLFLENVPAYLSLACYVIVFFGHCFFILHSTSVVALLGSPLQSETRPRKALQ